MRTVIGVWGPTPDRIRVARLSADPPPAPRPPGATCAHDAAPVTARATPTTSQNVWTRRIARPSQKKDGQEGRTAKTALLPSWRFVPRELDAIVPVER